MKNILFVVNHLQGGGIEQVLLDLVDLLEDSYSLSILSIYDGSSVYSNDLKKNVNVKTLDICRNRFNSKILKSIYSRLYDLFIVQSIFFLFYLKKHSCDTVVAFSDGLSVKLVSRCCRKNLFKKIAWIHTDFFADPDLNSDKLKKIVDLYKYFDQVITVSKNLELKFLEYIQKKNVRCIYNPLNPNRFSNLYISKETSQTINIIAVGRLSWEKGFDRLLTSVYATPKDIRKKFHLTIIGDGVEKNSLKNMIERLGISENITMTGFVKDPFLHYNSANVLLVPSRFEGFGLVLLEAMRCNIPIIATETSGTKEILSDGKFGMLLPNADNAFDHIFEFVCTHPNYFNNYINKYHQALERFDPSRIKEQLKSVL